MGTSRASLLHVLPPFLRASALNPLFHYRHCWHSFFALKFSTTFLNSITSSGHSGQLLIQHTIPSHPSSGCMCSRKFLLSYSSSSFTGWHLFGPTSLIASTSGKPACTRVIQSPSSCATPPNTNSTPCSFVGAKLNGPNIGSP